MRFAAEQTSSRSAIKAELIFEPYSLMKVIYFVFDKSQNLNRIGIVYLAEDYNPKIPELLIIGDKQITEESLIERNIRAIVHMTAPTDVEERILP